MCNFSSTYYRYLTRIFLHVPSLQLLQISSNLLLLFSSISLHAFPFFHFVLLIFHYLNAFFIACFFFSNNSRYSFFILIFMLIIYIHFYWCTTLFGYLFFTPYLIFFIDMRFFMSSWNYCSWFFSLLATFFAFSLLYFSFTSYSFFIVSL